MDSACLSVGLGLGVGLDFGLGGCLSNTKMRRFVIISTVKSMPFIGTANMEQGLAVGSGLGFDVRDGRSRSDDNYPTCHTHERQSHQAYELRRMGGTWSRESNVR